MELLDAQQIHVEAKIGGRQGWWKGSPAIHPIYPSRTSNRAEEESNRAG